MQFEFDRRKSAANARKQGIDFDAAQELWSDPDLVEVPARTVDELRALVIGKIAGKYWSVVITSREGRTRIISVRRARDEEVEIYESAGL